MESKPYGILIPDIDFDEKRLEEIFHQCDTMGCLFIDESCGIDLSSVITRLDEQGKTVEANLIDENTNGRC